MANEQHHFMSYKVSLWNNVLYLPSDNSEELIPTASRNCSPTAWLFFTRSLPARSTRWSWEVSRSDDFSSAALVESGLITVFD